MASPIVIGRIGVDSGIELIPRDVDFDGDVMRVSGELFDMTEPEWAWTRQNVLNLLDNRDEPVVPVTWAADPRLDGYYAPVGASVRGSVGHLANGRLDWSIDLQRIFGGLNVDIDDTYIAFLRVHDHGNGASAAFTNAWIPAEMLPLEDPDDGLTVISTDIRPADTTSPGLAMGTLSDPLATVPNFALRHRIAPEDYYDGGCKVEIDLDGTSTWRDLNGLTVPGNPNGRWRISNGVMRVSQSGTTGDLVVEYWGNTNAWEELGTFRVGNITGFTGATDGEGCYVTENSPLGAKIHYRLSYGTVSAGIAATVDVSLRRGDQFVEILAMGSTFVFGSTTTVACTWTPFGAYRTAANAAGNHFAILTPDAHTKDLANGRLTPTLTNTPRFAVAAYRENSPGEPPFPNNRDGVINGYIGVLASARRFLSR